MVDMLEEAEAGEPEHEDALHHLVGPPGGGQHQVRAVLGAPGKQHGVYSEGARAQVPD